jgi:hypothetical protein
LVGPKGDQGNQGDQGIQGVSGANGKTILSGAGFPDTGLGMDGDFYINTAAETIYGPKTSGDWGAPTNLVGSQGSAGADGRTILNGSGAPSAGVGSDGDFYIDTSADTIYGPKAGGTWGGSISLVGPQGPQGDTGDVGAQGPQGDTGAQGAEGPAGPGVTPYYGSFYSTGDEAATDGQITPISLNADFPGVSGVSRATEPANDGAVRVTNAGLYNFQFSAQIAKSGAKDGALNIWPQVNTDGTWQDADWSNSQVTLTSDKDRGVPSWNFFFELPAGGMFRMVMSPEPGQNGLRVDSVAAGGSPSHPAIPGLIVSVNRIG